MQFFPPLPVPDILSSVHLSDLSWMISLSLSLSWNSSVHNPMYHLSLNKTVVYSVTRWRAAATRLESHVWNIEWNQEDGGWMRRHQTTDTALLRAYKWETGLLYWISDQRKGVGRLKECNLRQMEDVGHVQAEHGYGSIRRRKTGAALKSRWWQDGRSKGVQYEWTRSMVWLAEWCIMWKLPVDSRHV